MMEQKRMWIEFSFIQNGERYIGFGHYAMGPRTTRRQLAEQYRRDNAAAGIVISDVRVARENVPEDDPILFMMMERAKAE